MPTAAAGPTVSLLSRLPEAGAAEDVLPLLAGRGLRLERIVSAGHASPDGFWYDQVEAEWVMVLAGRARLAIEGESTPRALGPGDAVFLPPRCRHRVDWTDPDQPTVWLALFVESGLTPSTAGRAPASLTPSA